MTGAEVIIKYKGAGLLGKVRSGGGDTLDFFLPATVNAFKGSAQDLWDAFIAFCNTKHSGPQQPAHAIRTNHPNGFLFQIPPDTAADFDALYALAEEELEKLYPPGTDANHEEGYFCGYADYLYGIDLDKDGADRFICAPDDVEY